MMASSSTRSGTFETGRWSLSCGPERILLRLSTTAILRIRNPETRCRGVKVGGTSDRPESRFPDYLIHDKVISRWLPSNSLRSSIQVANREQHTKQETSSWTMLDASAATQAPSQRASA